MAGRRIGPTAPGPSLEPYKAAYSCLLSGDDTASTQLLDTVSVTDGIRRNWDSVREALWNCTDRLPGEHWQSFQFANENPSPICYAYAVRMDSMGSLVMGFLETENYDAMDNLYSGLMDGLEGPS